MISIAFFEAKRLGDEGRGQQFWCAGCDCSFIAEDNVCFLSVQFTDDNRKSMRQATASLCPICARLPRAALTDLAIANFGEPALQ
jgi:hypothetical protein